MILLSKKINHECNNLEINITIRLDEKLLVKFLVKNDKLS